MPNTASVDTTTPSIARCYDAFLGGKDNFAVDRASVDQVLSLLPSARDAAYANRRWLVRVVRWLATEAGMDQFLDCGAGLPTQENTHEVAQRNNTSAQVVYVDNDPACQAYGRALLEENTSTHFAAADLQEPETLLHSEQVAAHLDLSRPLVLLQCSTMHHVPDRANPYEIMQRYRTALPSGSYVALTHFWDPEDKGEQSHLCRQIEDVMAETVGAGSFRTREQIQAYFDGFDMIPPGLVQLNEWWPDGPQLRQPTLGEQLCLGGLARKP